MAGRRGGGPGGAEPHPALGAPSADRGQRAKGTGHLDDFTGNQAGLTDSTLGLYDSRLVFHTSPVADVGIRARIADIRSYYYKVILVDTHAL